MIDPKFWVDPGVVEQFLTQLRWLFFSQLKAFFTLLLTSVFNPLLRTYSKTCLRLGWWSFVCQRYRKSFFEAVSCDYFVLQQKNCDERMTVYILGNRAKGQISKRVFQENKTRQIFRKKNNSYPLICRRTCVSRSKKCSFFRKFDVLCFLATPVLKFALLPYCRRYTVL